MESSRPKSTPILSVFRISTGYGPIEVLKGISLEVFEGEIVTLLGANGAGKTSTLMTLSGIQPLWQGRIDFFGQDISKIPSFERVKLGLSQVPEGRKIFPRLTVLENLEMGAYLRTDNIAIHQDLEMVYSLFPILSERKCQLGGTLSGGEQQMLAIGRALMSRPKLLLMDEPSMGVAPLLVQKIFETLSELNKLGLTIFLVEQNAHLALKLAHRGYVLETGEVTLHDTSEKLIRDPAVRKAYLGEL